MKAVRGAGPVVTEETAPLGVILPPLLSTGTVFSPCFTAMLLSFI